MSTAKKNVPAVQQPGGLPAELMDQMTALAGVGVSTNPNDVGIPYWTILQDLSPQVKKRDEAYIEGAEPGDLFNTATKQVIKGDDGIDVIPCYFESAQVEWVPRGSGGGFVAKHPANTELLQQVRRVDNGEGKMSNRLPSGNDLVETRYWYGFVRPHVEEGETPADWEPAVIGMQSTALKSSRDWMGMVRRNKLPGGQEAPIFSKVYVLRSVLKEKGDNDWFIWGAADLRWVDSTELQAALAFHKDAAAGAVKVSNPTEGGLDAGIPDENVV